MTPLQKRALRTAIVVVAALHVVNCPSVASGPDTGCVRTGRIVNDGELEKIGRLFPELPENSPIIVLRIDETETGIAPTAQYIDKYRAEPTDPFSLLSRLGIEECQCIRADGFECDAEPGVDDPTRGNPVACKPIGILGIDAHRPRNGRFETCIFDKDCNVDADGGALPLIDGGLEERCVERSCTLPLILEYAPAQQRYVPTQGVVPTGSFERVSLTIELYPDTGGSSAAGTCPTSIAIAKLTTVTRTQVLTPTAGQAVPRAEDLVVTWESGGTGSPAGFVVAIVRGTLGSQQRTLLCRGLDLDARLRVHASQLSRLDPGAIELEVQRVNAVGIVAPPTQGGSILSISTRKLQLTLQ